MDGSGLRLVGGDADVDHESGLEPPAPFSFKEYAKRFPVLRSARNPHVELEGHPIPFPLPGGGHVDDVFDTISRKIGDLAKALGLDDDTDGPRAA